jgi:hypothetical protein
MEQKVAALEAALTQSNAAAVAMTTQIAQTIGDANKQVPFQCPPAASLACSDEVKS